MVNPHGETYGICKNKCLVEVSPKEDVVHKSGDETIPGNKTFTGNVTFGTSGSPRQVSLKGDLVIDGNISQSGANYETHAEEVYTKQDKIILRDGAVSGLGVNERTGFTFKKYDGANDGNLVVGADGTAYVGDTGDLQPILTRAPVNSMVAGKPIVWDSAGARAVTTNAIDEALALKADKTWVNSGLALKADKTEVATLGGLDLKADKTELALKADKTTVNDGLALKADITYVDTEIAGIDVAPPIATYEEAIAGVDDSKMMTPLKVFDLIVQLLPPVDCATLLTGYKNDTSITFLPLINAGRCTSLERVVYFCTNLKKIDRIIAPNVSNMEGAFYACSSLTTIPLLDTSKVTSMYEMFRGCSSLTTIPLLDTSKVTNMHTMFHSCSSLTTVPMLNISKVSDMTEMFHNCSALTSVTFQCNDVRPYGGGNYGRHMFSSTPIASKNGYIFVPDNLVQAYRTATGWKDYASIIFGHSDKANM